MIVTVVDPKQFIDKSKLITYIRAFVKLYNWENCKQVYETHRIVELEKICTSIAKYPCNLNAYCIIEIFSILRSTYVIPKN